MCAGVKCVGGCGSTIVQEQLAQCLSAMLSVLNSFVVHLKDHNTMLAMNIDHSSNILLFLSI